MKNQTTQFKKAQDAFTQTKKAIAAVATHEQLWLNRLQELDKLCLEAMTKAFEDDAEVGPNEFDKLAAEMTLIRQRLESMPGLKKHLAEIEKDRSARLQEEQAELVKTQSSTEYLKLRNALISDPHDLDANEERQLRVAAARSGYRDDLDKLLPAIDLFIQHRRRGVAAEFFVWEDNSASSVNHCQSGVKHG